MDSSSSVESEARFSAYVDGHSGVIGHAGRSGPLRDHGLGLLPPGDRKSVEPMAAPRLPACAPWQAGPFARLEESLPNRPHTPRAKRLSTSSK